MRIDNPESASKSLRCAGYVTYFVGLWLVIVAFAFRVPLDSLDGFVCLIFAYLLYRYHSRTIAILLLFNALSELMDAAYDIITNYSFEKDYVLPIVVILIAMRAIYSSFMYHQLIGTKTLMHNMLIKIGCSIVYFLIGWFLTVAAQIFISLKVVHNPFLLNSFMVFWLILLIMLPWLCFLGWLPFTRNKPVCVYPSDTVSTALRRI